jgi:hypothetical protein
MVLGVWLLVFYCGVLVLYLYDTEDWYAERVRQQTRDRLLEQMQVTLNEAKAHLDSSGRHLDNAMAIARRMGDGLESVRTEAMEILDMLREAHPKESSDD